MIEKRDSNIEDVVLVGVITASKRSMGTDIAYNLRALVSNMLCSKGLSGSPRKWAVAWAARMVAMLRFASITRSASSKEDVWAMRCSSPSLAENSRTVSA